MCDLWQVVGPYGNWISQGTKQASVIFRQSSTVTSLPGENGRPGVPLPRKKYEKDMRVSDGKTNSCACFGPCASGCRFFVHPEYGKSRADANAADVSEDRAAPGRAAIPQVGA